MSEFTIIGKIPNKIDHTRENVRIILYNPKTDLFALQYSGLTNFYGTLGGGIEFGDSVLETVSKELSEETGYVDFSIITELGKIKAYFSDQGKNKERISYGFLLFLNSEKNIGTSLTLEEIQQQAQTIWKNKNQIIDIFEKLIKIDEGTLYHYEFFKRAVKFLEKT